ncbi:MAG: winged helix-turn-helix transcriptional regulator [Halanaerobiales bacterium]|nr:winged helix-turn-helix transcriptional regulator [Halanaerobiales bacterium]
MVNNKGVIFVENMTDKFDTLKEKSEILKALSHPVRLCIVKGLMKTKVSNVTTIQDCLDIPQSTISQHIAKLKSAGIVDGTRDGVKIHYYVVNEDARKIISALFDK